MAFDQAAGNDSRYASVENNKKNLSVSADGSNNSGNVDISSLSNKVWTLMQTCTSIESLSEAIGLANDTIQLREKILSAGRRAESLVNEIDAGIKKMRVQSMQNPETAMKQQLNKVENDYAQVKAKLIDTIKKSQMKQRSYQPKESTLKVVKGSAAASDLEDGRSKRILNPANPNVMIQLKALHGVEDDIQSEKAAEARMILKDTSELHSMMKDMSELIEEQGQSLELVEEQVDETREAVMAGNRELEKAAQYQMQYRRKWCFVVIAIILIACAIFIPILIHVLPNINF
jgi:t-SNARE complex subunit (syntaxin)